jgi:acyl carrier protein phosphodiesterase
VGDEKGAVNFLAHLWLADQARVPLAGAILGDWFRGALPEDLPPDLALSVRLHRRVDVETDKHPLVAAARTRFPRSSRRYSGIVLDLLYDHALALDWARFSGETLDAFAARAAQAVGDGARWFERAGGPVPATAGFRDLLMSYAAEAGFENAARRTARRLRQPAGMLEALKGWKQHIPEARADLPVLMEDLKGLAQAFVNRGQSPISKSLI